MTAVLAQCLERWKTDGNLPAQVALRDRALDKLRQGMCVFDGQQRLVLFNRCYAEMYRLPPEDLCIGMTLRDVVDPRYAAGTGPDMPKEEFLAWQESIQIASRTREMVVVSSGHRHEIHHEPTSDGGGVATLDDITERRCSKQRIQHMAHHDALTGLPNRTLFAERPQKMTEHLARSERVAVVICLDLDRFKEVNDTLSHPAGHALLRQVTERIRQEVRQTDTLAWLRGDEFAVILDDLKKAAEASAFTERLICALSAPFDLEPQAVTIGVSAGIALCSGADLRPEPNHVLRCADVALYRATAEGRNGYQFFQPGMDTQMQRRRSMERDLQQPVTEGQFILHYQPQFDLDTGRLTGVEALLRWQHPEQGMILPDDFIPLCEETGLNVPLGTWVLQTACAQALRRREVRLAVNLSLVQLQRPGVVLLVDQVLRETGLSPGLLELEITEDMVLQDTPQTLKALGGLQALGVGVVLAVAMLGRSLGMRVNAEGIETPKQLACLQALGCDEGQGYPLGHSAAPDRLISLLTTVGAAVRQSRV